MIFITAPRSVRHTYFAV